MDPVNEFTQNATTATNNVRITSATTGTAASVNSLIVTGATLSMNALTLTDASGAILFAGTAPAISGTTTGNVSFGANEGFITVVPGTTATISALLAGTVTAANNALTVSGGGTLVLSGVDTAFTGGVTITGGTTVNITLGNNLGTGTKNITLTDGGRLNVGATYSDTAATNNFVIGTGGGTFNIGTGFTFTLGTANQLTGSGPLTVTGTTTTGNLTLAATQSYTGTTTIGSPTAGTTGIVNANVAGSMGTPTAGTNNAAVILGAASGSGNATLNMTITVTQTLANPISTTAGGTSGTLTLGVTGGFAGLYSGPLSLNNNNTSLTLNVATTAGSLNLSGYVSGTENIIVNTVNVTSPVILSQVDTYSGTTTVNNASLLRLGLLNSGSKYSAINLNGATATFDIIAFSSTIGSFTGSGIVTDSGAAATLTTGLDGTSTTFTGNLTGANLSLVKIGNGVLSLRGSANTAASTAGSLTIQGGGVTLDGATTNTLNFAGGYVVNANGTLTLNDATTNFNNRLSGGSAATFRAMTLGGGTLAINGNTTASTPTSEAFSTLTLASRRQHDHADSQRAQSAHRQHHHPSRRWPMGPLCFSPGPASAARRATAWPR